VRRHKLQENDVVKIGMHEITYHRSEPPDATMVLPDDDEVNEEEEAAEQEDGPQG
jgi:hypothetical protein